MTRGPLLPACAAGLGCTCPLLNGEMGTCVERQTVEVGRVRSGVPALTYWGGLHQLTAPVVFAL
jgi:hypothetical protein